MAWNPSDIKKDIVRTLKHRIPENFDYNYSLLRSSSAVKLLLISDLEAYTSEQQLAPFHSYRSLLRKQKNIIFHHVILNDVLLDPVRATSNYDAICLKLSYKTDQNTVDHIVDLISISKPGNCKLIYFDGDDDSCILWPSILNQTDLYVKKHIFTNQEMYTKQFLGKSNLTDYVSKTFNVSFENDAITNKNQPVEPKLLDRLYLGYNLALDEKITELYHKTKRLWQTQNRSNDITCRASLDNWLVYIRKDVITNLEQLKPQYKIITPAKKVSQKEYDTEMMSSKICVSPFGYGEICWRDFEAVLWGCLLVKPDMSHIKTRPDIFQPYETYVPVKWDFSDLNETCLHYLNNEKEIKRITENAYEVLNDFYKKNKFLDITTELLNLAGVDMGTKISISSESMR